MIVTPKLDGKFKGALVGDKIAEARKACGLTQKELACAVGFETATPISFIENYKRTVTADTLYDISQVTNKPIEWFYQ